MIKQAFEIKGGEQFAKLGEQFVKATQEELRSALEDTLEEGKKILRDSIARANANFTEKLSESVTSKIHGLSQFNWNVWGEVTFDKPGSDYSQEADKGAGPDPSVSLAKIRAWVRHKGLEPSAAYPITRQLRLKGTAVSKWSKFGRTSFMDKAERLVDKEAKKQYEKAMARVQRRMDSYASDSSRRT
jgi:hypothetical protein